MCNPSETKQENIVLLVPNELQENSEQFHKKLWSCIFTESFELTEETCELISGTPKNMHSHSSFS